MKDLHAMKLDRFPVEGLRHVRDLIYFDGPLLSLFKRPNGENFLYYWCDCDADANRWMVLRVSEVTLLRLTNQIVTLQEVIPGATRDDYIYFLDVDAANNSVAYLCTPTSVPEDYRPVSGHFLEPQDEPQDTHSYSFLMQGEWSVNAIGDFPKAFNKIYSLLYGMNKLQNQGFVSHPWRGGFSSYHFFNDAMTLVPRADKPYIDAIQKSSPGFLRFSLDTQTAQQAVQCVLDYKSNERYINEDLSELRRFIRRYSLNEISDSDAGEWVLVNPQLAVLAKNLLKGFTHLDENQFLSMCPRPFEAAKISLSFVKFVQELVNFERQGLIEFPKQMPESPR